MSPLPSVGQVQVEAVTFLPTVKPPASNKTLFLGGAGVRGLEIEGKFIKFSAIGVYLEDSAMPSLAVKWKGKSADELADSVEFFGDIVTDSEAIAIEKFVEVFKKEKFPPGSSILFTLLPNGSLAISFTKDEVIPEAENALIKNKLLSEAVLESIIGKHGVSPPARQSLATRLSELLK